jgi:hypothetical protein
METVMKKFLSMAAIAAFGLLGLPGVAHASYEDISLTSTDGVFSFASSSNSLSPNVNLTTAEGSGQLVLNANSAIYTSSNSTATAPTGTLFGGNFLAVMGDTGEGMSTFTMSPGQSGFGFTWGTIDDYNTLTITDSRGYTFTITGSELLSAISGVDHTTQSDVEISDAFGTITSAVLTSTQNSFEVANFSQTASAVPLPAALPLFGAAVLGLGLIAYRRRQAAKI